MDFAKLLREIEDEAKVKSPSTSITSESPNVPKMSLDSENKEQQSNHENETTTSSSTTSTTKITASYSIDQLAEEEKKESQNKIVQITEEEERSTGSIDRTVYRDFFKRAGSGYIMSLLVCHIFIYLIFNIFTQIYFNFYILIKQKLN